MLHNYLKISLLFIIGIMMSCKAQQIGQFHKVYDEGVFQLEKNNNTYRLSLSKIDTNMYYFFLEELTTKDSFRRAFYSYGVMEKEKDTLKVLTNNQLGVYFKDCIKHNYIQIDSTSFEYYNKQHKKMLAGTYTLLDTIPYKVDFAICYNEEFFHEMSRMDTTMNMVLYKYPVVNTLNSEKVIFKKGDKVKVLAEVKDKFTRKEYKLYYIEIEKTHKQGWVLRKDFSPHGVSLYQYKDGTKYRRDKNGIIEEID